jgi:hypothetical protein
MPPSQLLHSAAVGRKYSRQEHVLDDSCTDHQVTCSQRGWEDRIGPYVGIAELKARISLLSFRQT